MSGKTMTSITGVGVFICISVLAFIMDCHAFEKAPTQESKVIRPDKLPTVTIELVEVEEDNIVVKFKMEAVGKTPVLIAPSRLNVRLKMLDSAASGYNTKLLDDQKEFLIQPNIVYSNSLVVESLEWSDGKHRSNTPISNLKEGTYEVKINYGGTKEGLLLGDYDFDNNVDSNIVQFKIE